MFNENEMLKIIRNIFGQKISIMPVGNHELERNLVHCVQTDDKSISIFKLFLKKNRWNREIASLKLLSESDVLCPKLIDYGKLDCDTEWLRMTYFEGYSLNTVQKVIDKSNLIEIYKAMGQELGKLHSLKTFDFFGNWDENGNSIDNIKSYKAYFENHVDSIIKEFEVQQLPDDYLIKSSIEKLIKKMDIISQVKNSFLCHNDYSERNAIVRMHNGKWQLEAIIDFEQSLPSDKDKDLAYISNILERKNAIFEKAFWEGYKEYNCINEAYYSKRSFYLLYFGLYICSWSYKQAPEHYNEGIKLLKIYSSY